MNKKIIALFLITLAVLPAFVLAVKPANTGKPENPGPWKAVGKKQTVNIDGIEGEICAVMPSGSKGIQLWCYFSTQPTTLGGISAFSNWIGDNELKETTGTKLHAVGKLVGSIKTQEKAITMGYDAIWTNPIDAKQYYLKFNWMG